MTDEAPRDPDPHRLDRPIGPGQVRDGPDLDAGHRLAATAGTARPTTSGPRSGRAIGTGVAAGSSSTSSSARPSGRSAVSMQYTSGPRSRATHPRDASTRGSGDVTRTGRSSISVSASPLRQTRRSSTRRTPAASGTASPAGSWTLAARHQPGTRIDRVQGARRRFEDGHPDRAIPRVPGLDRRSAPSHRRRSRASSPVAN